jgi:hypothetical protein
MSKTFANAMTRRKLTAIEAITEVIEEDEHGRGQLEDITASLKKLTQVVALVFNDLSANRQVEILNEVHYAKWSIAGEEPCGQ